MVSVCRQMLDVTDMKLRRRQAIKGLIESQHSHNVHCDKVQLVDYVNWATSNARIAKVAYEMVEEAPE